jgi:hypothetical protein
VLSPPARAWNVASALEAGAEKVLSTASPVEEEIVGTVQRFVGG